MSERVKKGLEMDGWVYELQVESRRDDIFKEERRSQAGGQ